ncbi:hypothetical protein [Serratia proteamaculans]|uniref:hypothetical protein n=1 Tax=Serratia proteamaculans TaxID=28151 RepID=UPI00217C1D1E|nr:hypothetical protein [Serratia proteamaculans]CAI1945212.1 Uncharacterised protein [Serratia proteamaculans]
MKNNLVNQDIKTDKPVPMSYEALKAERDALAVENAALINSSVCKLQDDRPQHGFYASEWFIAKLKNGEYAALKSLPEEYSHDYRTNDGTYYTKDWVVGWMQTPDTEYRPNVKTPATDAAISAIEARGVEKFADAWEAETARIMEGAFFYPQIERRESVSKAVRQYIAELREAK